MGANGEKPNESLCLPVNDNIQEVVDDFETVTASDVVRNFQHFLNSYDYWRNQNGLSGSIDNVHEIISSMTDKLGRIARYVKHQERNDPKPDWPDGMTIEMAGLIVYTIILKNTYGVDIFKGFKAELEKAAKQHSNKGEK